MKNVFYIYIYIYIYSYMYMFLESFNLLLAGLCISGGWWNPFPGGDSRVAVERSGGTTC